MGDWHQAFTHSHIVTMPAFCLADKLGRQGLEGETGLAKRLDHRIAYFHGADPGGTFAVDVRGAQTLR